MEMAHGDRREIAARTPFYISEETTQHVILVSNYRKLPITSESVEQFLITNISVSC